ncbi:hypothetical protein ENUP19_0298G0065 [Entamoeba nuttalli]
MERNIIFPVRIRKVGKTKSINIIYNMRHEDLFTQEFEENEECDLEVKSILSGSFDFIKNHFIIEGKENVLDQVIVNADYP